METDQSSANSSHAKWN